MPPSHRIVKPKDSIENRRARGEISCAECRRHKLKCDKAIPCSTCVRKGCQSICPNGTLAPTHGTKTNPPATNAREVKLGEMTKRIRQLEDALQISHSAVSSTPHPLLAEDMLQIKSGALLPATDKDDDLTDTTLVESFGTLAVANGTEVYYGAPPHDLITHEMISSEIDAQSGPHMTLPPHISHLSKTFPFTPLYLPVHQLQEIIEGMLPSYSRATALVEAYLQNLSWFFRPLDREEIMEELIPIVYKGKQPPDHMEHAVSSSSDSPGGQARTDLHVLALLFAIFAVGAVADLTLPPWNDEGELYYELSRTALALKPVFEGAGIHAVEAIALLGAYNLFSCRNKGLEGTWKMLSFSLSLAASIGLNRDPAHFDLSPRIVQRRRRAFWELYSLDLLKSHATGRPSTFTPRVIDCELPEDDDPLVHEGAAEKLDSLWQMRHRYTRDIVMELADKLGAMRTVRYSEILALDQKIRQYDPQGLLRLSSAETKSDETEETPLHVRQWMMAMAKDISLLFLHRSFFARAIIEDPENPVRTRYGPSFLSMYRAAASMVHFVRSHFDKKSVFFVRCWPILAHALHATVILGSVAACGTASSLAPQAFIHFSLGYEMFKKAPMHPLISALVPIVTRLHVQAVEALAKHGHDVSSKLFSISAPAGTKRAHSQDFDAGEAFRRPARKSLDGELEAAASNLRTFSLHPGMSATAQPSGSTPSQASLPFAGVSTASVGQYDTPVMVPSSSSHGLPGNTESRMETDADSYPMDVKLGQDVAREKGDVAGPADVQLDFHPDQTGFSFESPSDHLFNPQLFDFPGSSTTDAFAAYPNFSDLMDDDGNMPGSSSTPVGDSSKMGPTSPPFHGDPFLFSSPSPGQFFTSDFDVSYDMRCSSGQESVLPLLPQDMEAWRTILQDSRFFGFTGETTEDDKGTPK